MSLLYLISYIVFTMGPCKSPRKGSQPNRKGKSSSKASNKSKKGPVANTSVGSNVVHASSTVDSDNTDNAPRAKKTSNKSLDKNPGVVIDGVTSSNDHSAPWFSSLVKDVASVLGKSPVKWKSVRVLGKEDGSSAKKNKSLDNNESESDSDYYVDFDDDDYYQADEDNPDCVPVVQSSNKKSPNFGGSQKDEFLNFMQSFVESYKTSRFLQTSRVGNRLDFPQTSTLRILLILTQLVLWLLVALLFKEISNKGVESDQAPMILR